MFAQIHEETIEDRCAINRERLKMLKAKRETERLQLAEQKLDQQFRLLSSFLLVDTLCSRCIKL